MRGKEPESPCLLRSYVMDEASDGVPAYNMIYVCTILEYESI